MTTIRRGNDYPEAEELILETLERIELLLTRIADAVAPGPEELERRRAIAEEEAFQTSKATWERIAHSRPSMTNAIGGPQIGRGVR